MICVAIIEHLPSRLDCIRNWLVRFTMQRNCELDLIKFTDTDPRNKLEKYSQQIQIALISLDNEQGDQIGQYLYERNQDCRICYYREQPCAMEELLLTRPIGFYLWKEDQEAFMRCFTAIYNEVLHAYTTFRYETKSKMLLLPKRNILYFQSDLRYVNICMQQGECPRVLAKLSELEQQAGEGFVRVHKSYLVNYIHILWIDKKSHTVLLSNGEQLPISDAQYDNVCKQFQYVQQ